MIVLSQLPLWLSGLLVVVLPTLVAMAGPAFVRRHYTLDRLITNNEVAGFKFATVGVIYAVLLGFAVIVVWEQFRDAETAVTREAGAAASLYRLSDGLGSTAATKLRAGLTDYLHTTIVKDWPAMARAGSDRSVSRLLTALYNDVLRQPRDPANGPVLSAILEQFTALTSARQDRLGLARGVVPGVIWVVLFLGGCVTVGFTFFLASRNLRAQIFMVALLSVLICMALLVIVSIDYPFTGSVKVHPGPLEYVLQEFGGRP